MSLPPDDKRHGTYTGYKNHHCRCFHCRLADHNYRAHRANNPNPKVDAEPARRHYEEWARRTGGGRVAFSNLAGLSPTTVLMFTNGTRATIYRATSDAALSVPLDELPRDCDEVSVVPTRRKAQALAAIGWSFKEQSRMVDRSPEWMGGVIKKRHVKVATHDLVDELYQRLHMTPNPKPATRVRNEAAKKGWAPPLAWNDIDTDDNPRGVGWKPRNEGDRYRGHDYDETVVERILGGDYNTPSTPVEKTAVCARWVAMGRSLNELGRRTGWKVERYYKESAA